MPELIVYLNDGQSIKGQMVDQFDHVGLSIDQDLGVTLRNEVGQFAVPWHSVLYMKESFGAND